MMFIEKTALYFDSDALAQAAAPLLNNDKYRHETDQICFTGTSPDDSPLLGVGSLEYYYLGKERYPRKPIISESDFTCFLDEFKGSLFQEVYEKISSAHKVGRMRLMTLLPKTIYTFHFDRNKRMHFGITGETSSCGFISNNRVFSIEADGYGYMMDTTERHTAYNASYNVNRTHLVIDILDEQ